MSEELTPPARHPRGRRLVHKGCGGTVEWVDLNDIDESYVCEKCGQEVDGEDLEVSA